jgi:NAD(P)H-dependent flavin oxidoreductase YrpB (nitropropane dioxygenase family)
VIEAVAPVPVLAAGGIADANAVDAVMHMGAAGAWVGTRFVASHESLAHDIYKQRLVAASTDDTYHGHFYSYGWRLGTPYRAIRSKEPWNPLHLIAGGARRTDAEKYARSFSVYGGQGVENIREILGAGEIVDRLLRRAR